MEQAIRVATALGLLALVCLLMTAPGRAEDYPTADRDSMWSDPGTYMIGSFRHMGEIYPSRPVHRAGPVSDLPRGTPVAAPVYDDDGTTRPLEDYFKRARVTGFIVLKRGKIVFERYRLGADEKSLFTSWSMAKSFVSTLVGFAVADGQIRSLDDSVSDYLPELKGSAYDGVPIKAVLQMSSGVAFTEDYVSSVSDSDRMWDEAVQYNKQPLTNFARDSKRAVAALHPLQLCRGGYGGAGLAGLARYGEDSRRGSLGEALGSAGHGGRCRLDDRRPRPPGERDRLLLPGRRLARLRPLRPVHVPGRRLAGPPASAPRLGRGRHAFGPARRSSPASSIRAIRWAININGGCCRPGRTRSAASRRREFTASSSM